jgi:hypothetical protein
MIGGLEMNERPIPDAALRDANSVEMVRVWIAERGIHCSIKVGMYRDGMGIEEEAAWGTILADIARHISAALSDGREEQAETVEKIRNKFNDELLRPTSDLRGGFKNKPKK